MPRFYFDVREGSRFTSDDEGFEYPDLNAAERIAAQTALSIGRDQLPARDIGNVAIEVRDHDRQHVLTVTMSLTTERLRPEQPSYAYRPG